MAWREDARMEVNARALAGGGVPRLKARARPRAPQPPSSPPPWREALFSVSEARRALPYVARIAADAAHAFHQAMTARARLKAAGQSLPESARLELSRQRDAAVRALNNAIDDCNAVGADLVNLATGCVSLPCELHGRRACLLWRVGESVAGAWSDL